MEKVKKPRQRKSAKSKMQSESVADIQVQEVQPETSPEQKKQVIIGIDPGFKKSGFSSISCKDGKFIDCWQVCFKPDRKMTQAESDGIISKNAQKEMQRIFLEYDVQYVVIELQLGQFSCTNIQMLLVSCVPENVKYVINHSKLKLKFKETKSLVCENPDSKKYNQNKMMGRQLCGVLYPELKKENLKEGESCLSYDEFDSVLHARYCFDNLEHILWITKEKLE